MDAAELEKRELPIPDGLNAPVEQVMELARVWWNGTGPVMNIRPVLQNPANIGVVLAELAFHFSHAYAQHHGLDQAKSFDEIRAGWDAAHEQAAATANSEVAQ